MNIHGNKTILRAIELKDNEMLFELINDPETEAFLGGASFPVSMFEQMKWFERKEKNDSVLRCIIECKETKVAVGTIILTDINVKNGTAEIHVKLRKDIGRGKGYGTDAIKSIVNYAFNEMRLNCIYANILENNEISKKVFTKCGFEYEGKLRSRVFKSGKFINILSYSILRDND